jgi:phosphatidate cytidylyltransferase
MSATRVLTSSLLVPLLLIVVWFLPPLCFALLAAAAAAIGQRELYAMARQRGTNPLSVTGVIVGAAVVLSMARPLPAMSGGALPWAVLSVLTVLTARLFSSRPVEGALEDVAMTLFGIVYVALLFGYQVAIHSGMPGKRWLLFLYFVIWASDIGAYYVGSAYGRHRLYQKISPKKSVEGLLGGAAAAMIAALLCKFWLVGSLGWLEALIVGCGLALIGTVGDLAESLLKRSVGVKDSGTIIPGHGGILDRLDSLMFAAPVLYYYLRMR